MKQLYGKLWVKCTAIALLIVFAVLLAASALGIAYLINYGAYADGGEQVRQIAENNLLQQTNGDGWAALHAWAEDDTVSRNLLRDRYDPLTSNIYFKLTDKATGEILFSTGALNKDDYSGKASAYYQQDIEHFAERRRRRHSGLSGVSQKPACSARFRAVRYDMG
ncbi:MAG: hypothetical protein ACLU3I_03640 [Acutalibacteraceae bacterium]